MPLHLLGKKSWNVYNAANIARVKQDEAEAAAREDAEEQRMQEEDAARRVAILRGEKVPTLIQPSRSSNDFDHTTKRSDRHDTDRRRKRRLRGEDDTDRDIRLAREDAANGEQVASRLQENAYSKEDDSPLVDAAGHLQLIPVLKQDSQSHDTKEAHHRLKRQRTNNDEDQGIRFRDAAGYNQASSPWYTTTSTKSTRKLDLTKNDRSMMLSSLEGKDVWGNQDPRRKDREQKRITSNDPFAIMQLAQQQLKQSEIDRKTWDKEREAETKRMRRESRERSHRRHHHHHHRDRNCDRSEDQRNLEFDDDSLDGFRLDDDVQPNKHPEDDPKRRRGHRRDHHHSSHRDHYSSHRSRIQSLQRD